MKTTRKRCSADFKIQVALEAIRGDLTAAHLAAKVIDVAVLEKLHAKIGPLVIERHF